MKKVVFFCPSTTWGGVEKNVLLRSKFLGEKGYKVYVVLLKNHFLSKFDNLDNVEVIPINSRGNDLNVFTIIKYRKLLKNIQPQGVFSALKKDWWLVSMAAYLANVPTIILYLGIKRKIKNSLKYKLVFNSLKAKVLVNSDSLKKHLLDTTTYFNTTNLFRIYNGFNIPSGNLEKIDFSKNLKTNNETFYIGCAGRFSRQKGFDLLPDIVQNLPENMHVVHIGEGPLEEEIKTLVQNSKVSNRIHFLGYSSNTEAFFNSIDVFLLPSRFEGMANVLNEALSYGKPVISTKVDGTCELLNDGEFGVITAIEDVNAMANAIKKIEAGSIKFDSEKLKNRIQTEFSIEKMISETEKLIFD